VRHPQKINVHFSDAEGPATRPSLGGNQNSTFSKSHLIYILRRQV
jgi:hypothetical protein